MLGQYVYAHVCTCFVYIYTHIMYYLCVCVCGRMSDTYDWDQKTSTKACYLGEKVYSIKDKNILYNIDNQIDATITAYC